MKNLILILVVFINYSVSVAQKFDAPIVSDRKIEVLAYAYVDLMPDDVYVSFILKEYKDKENVITIDKSVAEIKKNIVDIGCSPDDLNIGNIYGYVKTLDDGNSIFQPKVQYILRLNSIDCAHEFLNRTNKFALESFSIDQMNAKIQDVLFRKLQSQAFLNAKEKADVFLEIFGEHSGKLLELSEINASVSYPSNTFDGKTKRSIKPTDGIQYFESKSEKTKIVRYEYIAKVIFEIK